MSFIKFYKNSKQCFQNSRIASKEKTGFKNEIALLACLPNPIPFSDLPTALNGIIWRSDKVKVTQNSSQDLALGTEESHKYCLRPFSLRHTRLFMRVFRLWSYKLCTTICNPLNKLTWKTLSNAGKTFLVFHHSKRRVQKRQFPSGFYYVKQIKRFVILYSNQKLSTEPLTFFWHNKTQKKRVFTESINYHIRPCL